jgi:hypothetical protein
MNVGQYQIFIQMRWERSWMKDCISFDKGDQEDVTTKRLSFSQVRVNIGNRKRSLTSGLVGRDGKTGGLGSRAR